MIADTDLDSLQNESYMKMRIQNLMDHANQAKNDNDRAKFVFDQVSTMKNEPRFQSLVNSSLTERQVQKDRAVENKKNSE